MLTPRSIPRPAGQPPLAITAGVLAVLLVCACTSPTDPDNNGTAVVATVGSQRITQAEVQARIRGRLVELDVQRYEAMREGLNELVDGLLLEREAAARNVGIEELLNTEVVEKAEPLAAGDVERFFDENRSQLGGQSLTNLRGSIEDHLQEQRTVARRREFVASLRESGDVTILLKPPSIEVGDEGPSRGPAKAPVTIIEFSDFGCQYCKRVAATLEQVLNDYPDTVRVVYRHYPIQPDSQRVARAANCAHEQGRFWEYHDLLFANQHAHGNSALQLYARSVGLDESTFADCLQSDRAAAAVKQDESEGSAAGVSGTPSFFINGRPLSGALPYDAFKEAIEEALAAET